MPVLRTGEIECHLHPQWQRRIVPALLNVMDALTGTRDVPVADVLAAISGDTSTLDRAAVATRIPRTVLALMAGAALGLAGVALSSGARSALASRNEQYERFYLASSPRNLARHLTFTDRSRADRLVDRFLKEPY